LHAIFAWLTKERENKRNRRYKEERREKYWQNAFDRILVVYCLICAQEHVGTYATLIVF